MSTEISPDERRRLADLVGLNEQYLYQCLTGRREMEHKTAMRVERDSGGKLTRQMLCQKTFADTWPDLAEAKAGA